MKADTKAEREFMEQKKNKLLSDMIQNDTDKKMVQLVEAATDLSCGDICTLLEVAHSLPFVGNLEGGDTYINVLTREKESMVIAQYRHPTMICINAVSLGRLSAGKMSRLCTGRWKKAFPAVD